MRKAALTIIVATGASLVLAGNGLAGTFKCTVSEVTGKTVILDCGKRAAKFRAGDPVKLKLKEAKKRKRLEGC